MINPAAMMGLANDPALRALGQINTNLRTLAEMKAKDWDDGRKALKLQTIQDKKEAQDTQRLLGSQRAQEAKLRALMRSTQGSQQLDEFLTLSAVHSMESLHQKAQRPRTYLSLVSRRLPLSRKKFRF